MKTLNPFLCFWQHSGILEIENALFRENIIWSLVCASFPSSQSCSLSQGAQQHTVPVETSSAANGISLIPASLPLPKCILGSFAVPFLFHSQPLGRFEWAPAEMFSPKNKAACWISALGSINHQVGSCRKSWWVQSYQIELYHLLRPLPGKEINSSNVTQEVFIYIYICIWFLNERVIYHFCLMVLNLSRELLENPPTARQKWGKRRVRVLSVAGSFSLLIHPKL